MVKWENKMQILFSFFIYIELKICYNFDSIVGLIFMYYNYFKDGVRQ